jgi:hypothetical protein
MLSAWLDSGDLSSDAGCFGTSRETQTALVADRAQNEVRIWRAWSREDMAESDANALVRAIFPERIVLEESGMTSTGLNSPPSFLDAFVSDDEAESDKDLESDSEPDGQTEVDEVQTDGDGAILSYWGPEPGQSIVGKYSDPDGVEDNYDDDDDADTQTLEDDALTLVARGSRGPSRFNIAVPGAAIAITLACMLFGA